jgi:hypothetical protein
MPAQAELWGLVRMAIASIGAKLGFDVEQTEDLRIAVDELCTACAQGATATSILELACYWSGVGLFIECTVAPVSADGTEPMSDLPKGLSQQELSENILAALVDAYGVSQIEDGSRKGWLRKFA